MNEPALELAAVHGAAEVARVADLARAIWLEYYPKVIGREQAEYMVANLQSPSAIAEQTNAGMRYFLLKRVPAGDELGYAAVETRQPALFISKLYLLAEARGQGFGQRALQALARHARALGLARIELTVNRNNALALAAYARFGMKVTGEKYAEIGGGYAMDDYVVEMDLR